MESRLVHYLPNALLNHDYCFGYGLRWCQPKGSTGVNGVQSCLTALSGAGFSVLIWEK
jgi:hypothetical protein